MSFVFPREYRQVAWQEEKIRNDTVLRVLKKDQFHAGVRIQYAVLF